MYRYLAISALLAGLISAQTVPTLPTCATSCVTQSLPASCNLNPQCICTSESFLQGIACCVFEACEPADQQAALAYAHSICDPVGGSSLLPVSAGCSSTSASGNATTTSGTATGASTAASNSASTTSASETGSTSSTASQSTSSGASSSATSSSSPPSAASASTSSPTATPGAGSRMDIGLGAIGAGLLGLAAML